MAQQTQQQATAAQVDSLSTLFIDCSFTLVERKAFLENRFHRPIVFLDELSKAEASQVISELKQRRERH